VQFANGGLGSVHICGTAWHGSGEHLQAYGSEGTLVLRADGLLLGARRGDRSLLEFPTPAPDDMRVPDATPLLAPFMRLAREFAAAARTGEPRAPSFVDGLRVQEVIGGVQKSARDGQWVTLGR
jgi:predicted dehydrogenase